MMEMLGDRQGIDKLKHINKAEKVQEYKAMIKKGRFPVQLKQNSSYKVTTLELNNIAMLQILESENNLGVTKAAGTLTEGDFEKLLPLLNENEEKY